MLGFLIGNSLGDLYPLQNMAAQERALMAAQEHRHALASRSQADQRADFERLLEHLKRQTIQYERARLFSDQFIDDVAGQRIHTRFMLG